MLSFFRKKVSSKWNQDGKNNAERDEKKGIKSSTSGTEKCKESTEQVLGISQNTRDLALNKSASSLGESGPDRRGSVGITNDTNTNVCRDVLTPVISKNEFVQGINGVNNAWQGNEQAEDAVVFRNARDTAADTRRSVVDCGSFDPTVNVRGKREGSHTLDRFQRVAKDDSNKQSRTSKEVINLLLPKDSLSYKKEDSYLSKTGVQSFLDIMAGGRKKRNKGKKNKYDNNNRRSWSFNGHKSKIDAVLDVNVDEDNDCCESEGDAKLKQIDLQRSASVCEANETLTSFRQAVPTAVVSQDSRECQEVDCGQGLDSAETPACTSVWSGVGPQGEREDPCDAVTEPGSRAKTGEPVGSEAELHGRDSPLQSSRVSAKCDTGLPPQSDESPADFFKSLILEKYKNNPQSRRNSDSRQQDGVNIPQIDGAQSEIADSSICIADNTISHTVSTAFIHAENRDCLSDSCTNNPAAAMGATDSKPGSGTGSGSGTGDRGTQDNTLRKAENIPGDSDYVVSCGESREPINFTQTDFKETVCESAQFGDVASSELCETAISSGENSSEFCEPVHDSESLRPDLDDRDPPSEMPESKDGETTRLKNILRESIAEDGKVANKKHVTFHSVIDFDDGEKVNDDILLDDDSVVEDSFASLDDEDDDEVEFDSDTADNEEVPDPVYRITDANNKTITNEIETIGRDCPSCKSDDSTAIKCTEESEKLVTVINRHDDDNADLFTDAEDEIEVENNENLGLENSSTEELPESVDEISSESSEQAQPLEKDAFNTIIEVKESVAEVQESSSEYEDSNSDNSETEDESSVEEEASEKESIFDSEKVIEEVRSQYTAKVEEEEDDDSAYAELLRVVERQLMRGVAGQEGRLQDLQERAAALHRVQSEVCSARKEAEMVRQKLKHVEGDLSATRERNCDLLEQFEARADEIRQAERRADELAEEVVRLQKKLDILLPERDQLKELAATLRKERDQEKKINEEYAARRQTDSAERERSWRQEFERLRSQGAEREELLLADCEWKLRDVQRAAAERCRKAEGKLQEMQVAADKRCELADKQVVELRTEMATLRATSLEQQRALRQQALQSSSLEAAKETLEQEARRLRNMLVMEKDAMQTVKQQNAKELDEKELRLVARLADEARRAEQVGRQQRRQEECIQHEKLLKETHKKLEELKDILSKKEAQYAANLDKVEGKADWQIMEIRRSLDKAELKHAEAMEKLEEQYSTETERLTTESEKRVKELENALSSQACSARATLELVRGQMQAEHLDTLQRMKEQHRKDMEKQWEVFETDKEQCLERMKSECMMEGEEEREKRDKLLLRNIDDLKHELATREGDTSHLRIEARKANDARVSAERRLSEAQAALVARETAVRAEAARQAEAEKREARDTIDHLTKKCACLSNLFEDMRTRWNQAPGEAAQLRRALQDEKARAQALRRQLDALSRVRDGDSTQAGVMWRRKSYDAMNREGEEASQGVKKVVSSSSPSQQAVKPGPTSQQAVKQGSTSQQPAKHVSTSQQTVKPSNTFQQAVKHGSIPQQADKQGSTPQQAVKQGSPFQQANKTGLPCQQAVKQGSDGQQAVKQGSDCQQAVKQGSDCQQVVKQSPYFRQAVKQDPDLQAVKQGFINQQAVKQGSECQQNVKQQTTEVKPHPTEDKQYPSDSKTPQIETKPLPPKNRWLSGNLAKVEPKQKFAFPKQNDKDVANVNNVAGKWQNKVDECQQKSDASQIKPVCQLKPNIWQRRLDESQTKAKTVDLVNKSPISNVENVSVDENKEVESKSGSMNDFWSKMGRKKVTKIPKRVLSPPREPVDLPQVTVPVRIRQFSDRRKRL